ncbi:TPA: hypothetical protein RVP80_004285, partial [Escherichia coli]|nr:hypothetical protein [Escherichia coli]HEA2986434.1 hypothetical protein [Escherichia coli]
RDNIERRAYEIALASLEAEPVASCIIEDGSMCVDGFGEYVGHSLPDGTHQLYTVPPAPVVPEEMYWQDAPVEGSSKAAAYATGWNACRAAMLYSAVPASRAYKLPQTQFKQVADLYEMQFDDGRTCAFHTDAQKAVQWLQACDGNRVQEYVKLERLQNALSGNSPVTPDGWVMVPKRLTAENGAKGVLSGEFSETTFISCLECFGDDDCDTCDGSGRIEIKVPVTWSTIKSIWDKGIEYFAAKPSQEVK